LEKSSFRVNECPEEFSELAAPPQPFQKKNGSIFKIMSVLTASASDLPVQGNKEWSKAGEGLD